MNGNRISIPEEVVLSKIYLILGQKVMLDRDLAKLYGVKTKALKQVVEKFPAFSKRFYVWNDKNRVR